MNTIDLNDDTFDETVAASGRPVLVDFTAEWCTPCRVMGPVLDGLAADLAGRLAVARVDVDASPGLVGRFGILSMPTFVLFVDGIERLRMVGARPRPLLERELAQALAAGGMGASRPWPSPAPTSSCTPPSPTPSVASSARPWG